MQTHVLSAARCGLGLGLLVAIGGWGAAMAGGEGSPFAVEVIEYVPGSGIGFDFITGEPFADPQVALGRPTVDTTGDFTVAPPSAAVPVVPVYAAFRASELVTVGAGGSLTLRFGQRVEDDPDNPFGVDFLVFGNSQQVLGDGQSWLNGDPNDVTVGSGAIVEGGVVSVSQDGVTWFSFPASVAADGFAPTLGRQYRPDHPVAAVPGNLVWGAPTDPTVPLDPTLTGADFAGMTLAEMVTVYGRSAGGRGFDLADVGLPWVEYVRIENAAGSGVTPEVDAVADVAPWLESIDRAGAGATAAVPTGVDGVQR